MQITSKETKEALLKISNQDIKEGSLKLVSFVKYDKCFTLNSVVVDKKLASISDDFTAELKTLFCKELF